MVCAPRNLYLMHKEWLFIVDPFGATNSFTKVAKLGELSSCPAGRDHDPGDVPSTGDSMISCNFNAIWSDGKEYWLPRMHV